MSQLFVHWTLNTGDVNRFQSKTKDKHVDLIYTYDFVIVGTGAEFREIGCYPFNFCFFTFFFYCKILYDLLSFFLPNMCIVFLYVFMNILVILVRKITHILY